MGIEYDVYFDESIGMTHIAKHGVTIEEIDEVFSRGKYLKLNRDDSSNVAYKILDSGRFLTIVYRKYSNKNYFIITAYDEDDFSMKERMEDFENKD